MVKWLLIDSMLWLGLIWGRGMSVRAAVYQLYNDYLHT